MRERGQAARIRARRRVATFSGVAALLIASLTACIFEKGDYQGGGRQDQGAEGTTAEPSATTAPTPTPQPPATTTTTATTATPDGAPPPVLDAATGG